MSASSSRIMIAPVEDGRPLSDRTIDRLLGWWDVGGGRRLRRGARDLAGRCGAAVRWVSAPLLDQPVIAKGVAWLGGAGRLLGKAFAHEEPSTPPRREELRATIATEAPETSAPAPTPIVNERPATAELRPRTGELRPRTAEIRPRTSPSITRPVTATVVTPTTPSPVPITTTTALRCWSCLQRTRVRSPRRGGCFHCPSCQSVMLVLDPIMGLTCDTAQAGTRGITLNRQADETDPGT